MHHYELEDLGLSDSHPDPTLNRLVEVAAHLTGSPVSLVSVIEVDKDRQYFTARTGLDKEQTPLSHSFCRQVACLNEPLIIENSLEDFRVWDNPGIEALGIHAYLGVPVYGPKGEPIASLCVVDSKPRHWSAENLDMLRKLARCATDMIRSKFEIHESERLRREQRDFAQAISHDIKSPLITLSWVLDEVADLHDGDFSDDTRGLVERARRTASRAMRMVDEVLQLSQIDQSREPELVPVDLNRVIGEVKDSLGADIAHRDARVHIVDPLPTVLGDSSQLSMLFQNLVGNALKFHRPGKPPRVRISARQVDDLSEVTVADNGVGIPEQYQGKVFGLFERLHRRESYEGSGIGLSLVMRVVKNHGGTVHIDSDGESGTSFIVRLPHRLTAEENESAPMAKAA